MSLSKLLPANTVVRSIGRGLAGAFLLAAFLWPASASAQPTFTKSFSPATIGPGGVSTLRFDITTDGGPTVTGLAFVDTLPAAVVIASPANASTTCGVGSTLDAPNGGTTITFSGGGVGGSASCSVSVDVTSSTPGTHMNVSGDLTSSAGNSGPASADLSVSTDRPGFSKSFSPSSVSRGGRSTLTFTIDNTANASPVSQLSFTDNLPSGIAIANPANVFNDCETPPVLGTVTGIPGSSVISYGFLGTAAFPAVAAGGSCSIGVDVIGTGIGLLGNISSELSATVDGVNRSSGKASAVLEVTAGMLSLSKSFTNDPVPPGGTVNLEFVIESFSRDESATGIEFTDDLDATLSGLETISLPLSNPCGAGSQLTGTGMLSLTGGSLAAGGSCTFNVTLQVPIGATPGVYPNTTSPITGNIGGSPVVGTAATESLFVSPVPLLTKEFTNDPAGAGGDATLEFSITNTSTTSAATDITFLDILTTFLPSPLNVTLTPDGFCGGGSTMSVVSIDTGVQGLLVENASLAADGSCTFAVTLDIPIDLAAGTYVNTTEEITATVDGATRTGNPASDSIEIVAAPALSKQFTDDPVAPGGTVTLEFTLDNSGDNAIHTATDIAFTDDLAAVVTGLAAVGLPLNDLCGAGNGTLTGSVGDTLLTFSGGSLAAGETCTFSVTLQVPAMATAGLYTNSTSTVMATVQGAGAMSQGASDDLLVSGLTFTKEFTDDPVIPGGTVTLEFTLTNTSGDRDATGIFFADNLTAVLSGLTATGLPMNDVCGMGSQISGASTLIFTGGNLGAGTSCTFSVTLQVPAMAASDTYGNTTSDLIATIDGTPLVLPPAVDQLTVSGDVLLLTKTFTDDPVAPGGTVTLEFTVSNGDTENSVTAIEFSDNLDAALSGLVATGLPEANVCGVGSEISGTSVLSFTGGSLAPGASCTFSVTLQVPAMVASGTTAVNTTSSLTGDAGGLAVTGDPATDQLTISFLSFSKTFESVADSGGTVQLTFHIENLNATAAVLTLSFLDNLNTTLTGLAATGLPLNNICGSGSSITGSSILAFLGGNLPPGGSCTFSVNLAVPAAPLAGDFVNTTSDLTVGGLFGADPASDTLQVRTSITNSATATASGAVPAMGQTTNTVQP